MSANPFNDQLWAQVCQAFDEGWDYGAQEKLNHKGKRAEGLRRAIAAIDAADFAVVPKKMTEKMQDAFVALSYNDDGPPLEVYSFDAWDAFLTAAKDAAR